MDVFLVAVCAVLGLAVGSFLNVVVWRVPQRESVVTPGSHCPACDEPIRAHENIPVVSWLVLRGRCRACGNRISLRYPLVELGTAALWALLALRVGASWALPSYLVLGAALLALALIDLDTFLLPNAIVYPLAVALVVLFGVGALGDGDGGAWVRAVLGGLAAFGFFLVVHLVSPRGMGFGDVKLSFCLGVALGWLSWGHVFLGIFLGFLIGATTGLVLIATGKRGRRDHVPFGPFLAAGALTAVLVGQPILDLYLNR